jgi:hypothetical protein
MGQVEGSHAAPQVHSKIPPKAFPAPSGTAAHLLQDARRSEWDSVLSRLTTAITSADGLEARSLLNARDRDGITLLHLAVLQRRDTYVVILLRMGASPSQLDTLGRTPMWYVARFVGAHWQLPPRPPTTATAPLPPRCVSFGNCG